MNANTLGVENYLLEIYNSWPYNIREWSVGQVGYCVLCVTIQVSMRISAAVAVERVS